MAMAVVGLVHCGGPAKAGGEGAECYRTEECAAGLVCLERVAGSGGGRVCTSDLSSVDFPSDAAVITIPDAAAPD